MKNGWTERIAAIDRISLLVFGAGVILLLAAFFFMYYSRRKQNHWLENMEEMLEKAEKGEFHEDRWDESQTSRLEARMAVFLRRSILSDKKLTEEENKIKKMLSDISHQTKTPIANILLYSELLKEKNLPKECTQMAEEIYWQGAKMKWLVESLVKISRLEQKVIQVTPKQQTIRPMLEKAVRAYEEKAREKGITLSFSCEKGEEAVYDPKWTGEALANLLDNGIKYTPTGGTVRIQAVSYALFERIDVIDTGIGIPEEEQSRVFLRFYRGGNVKQKQGVGIGLHLAREIIKKEGGYMKLSSELGVGSCFSIFLPKDRKEEDEIG